MMTGVVKAAAGPGIEVRSMPVPRPGRGEVLVEVKAAGICGSDVHIFKWSPMYHWMASYLPVVLGHEFSGQIVELGEGVTSLSVGQRVVCKHIVPCGTCRDCREGRPHMCLPCRSRALGLYRNGGFAGYVAVPEPNCIPMPDSMSYELGSLTQPMVLAVNSVDRARLRIGDTIVILGPGPIGLSVLVAAQSFGATAAIVVGVRGDEERLEIARKMGAGFTLGVDDGDPVRAVRDITCDYGADVVFEAAGVPEAINQGIGMLKRGGTLVSLGMHNRPASIDLTAFNRADLTLTGMHEGPITWERALSVVEANASKLVHMITARFRLEDAQAAFDSAARREGAKVLLIPSL